MEDLLDHHLPAPSPSIPRCCSYQRGLRLQLLPYHLGDDHRGPGYETDTTTTFAYKIAFRDQDIGQSAALAVGNFLVIFIFIMLFLKLSKWREADQT